MALDAPAAMSMGGENLIKKEKAGWEGKFSQSQSLTDNFSKISLSLVKKRIKKYASCGSQ
jgi:hypothetical protein